jgi:hypothetical protein
MSKQPEADLLSRLKVVRKLLFRSNPYIIVPVKPESMLRPRQPEYEIAPVAERLAAGLSAFRELLEALAAHFPAADEAYAAIRGNSFFGETDALMAFALVRHLRATRVVEVGSGNSTRILRAAGGASLHITCIDPEPRREIDGIATHVLRRSVLDCDAGHLLSLGAGDVLFIDGSHYIFNGTDATCLLLEILPRLPTGVVVHMHDIRLPYEYDLEFTRRHYNEPYLLAALLLGGRLWQPVLPVFFCHRRGLCGEGGSFWMRRA